MICREAIAEVFEGETGVLTTKEVTERVYANHPDRRWQKDTIRTTLIGLSVNHPTSKWYGSERKHAFLYSLGEGRYRRWDPERDGQWAVVDNRVQRVDNEEHVLENRIRPPETEGVDELTQEPPRLHPPSDPEYVRMYYEHQYDRMAKQEDQRHSMANIIVSLSVLAFTFAFASGQDLNLITGVLLPCVIIAANLIAWLYMQRTRSWIRTHRERAKAVLVRYAPDLTHIDDITPEKHEAYALGRGRLQQVLHIILAATAAAVIAYFVVLSIFL